MPALGSDMDEGTLNEWLVKPGDRVSRGQVVAVVETTKAAVEVECWHDGTIHELLVPIGETVQAGTALATLLAPGEKAEAHPKKRTKPARAPAAVEPGGRAAKQPAPARRSNVNSPPPTVGFSGCTSPRSVARDRRRHRDRHWSAGGGHDQRRRTCGGVGEETGDQAHRGGPRNRDA